MSQRSKEAPDTQPETLKDQKDVHYDVTVQLPLKRQYMVIFVAFRILQVVFSVIVLGTSAGLYSAKDGTCDLYRTYTYPSYGGNPIYTSSTSTADGNTSACSLGIASGVIGLFVGVTALMDAFMLLGGRVPPIDRDPAVYIVEWIVYLLMTMLWCATAIVLAIGYVSSCNGVVCSDAANKGVWETQAVALVAVIFTWLSIMPWASDFGLISREYFRRINYHRQIEKFAKEEQQLNDHEANAAEA